MKTVFIRVAVSVGLMFGMACVLYSLPSSTEIFIRTKVEVKEWEVMNKRTFDKLFKVSAVNNWQGASPSAPARYAPSDSSFFELYSNQHIKRAVY
ncbi:hypothetical protein QWY31_14795 [Cytophagales bacterium LB-30]|uniref:Uncharacterized protein n=1 Tax=Shiella aurantiaca TaxID=3058365 RepID=A0ABT8F8H3_9BACT|nr:hypothetical protein [Shiella aurantiaca]MDN4166777.1 hypothetical protein [Shiella aurantiaca]